MSDTPETDAMAHWCLSHVRWREFASDLERQRNRLAGMLEHEAKEIDAQGDEATARGIRRAIRNILETTSKPK